MIDTYLSDASMVMVLWFSFRLILW
uniref:Uncharacterized protein n=1 Tax=Arundo donax TaxID=35708 RepID=A0A0A9ENQ8_ARUDO